ncbi:MAG: hypothetical protein ACRESO_04120, partial [Gammaproteobacteria bacterium]
MVKTISAGLQTFLENNQVCNRVELLTITLQQGVGVLYFTSGLVSLVYNGHIYLAGEQGVNPGWKRGSATTKIGTSVTSMDLTLLGAADTYI